ncbi:unnamed protein product [Tilletia laevis]|uniref:Uncharacterized protein n=1 Tax=Tilletia caries TaxID=13290 RepID=A0ABN7J2H0_9BASI|nr:hypothetical protein CF336_g2257 [Tilletia laevis]CAD6910363.1 unnamed protein product [Tilletia caries]CAD6922826.1 unnamed protein product [Tilletia laevis]CAD6943792.1 unnamed protein product [Tilletia caries]CAD7067848.1 unnamed protein product [Tilletia caries]
MGPLKAPSSSHFWPNQYPPEHQGIIDEWIEDARRSTFIAGPFDPEEVKAVIGHVRASPVLLVQKLDEHGVVVKNRVVYNASHPRTSKLGKLTCVFDERSSFGALVDQGVVHNQDKLGTGKRAHARQQKILEPEKEPLLRDRS